MATLVVYTTNALLLHEITAKLPNITAWAYASTPQSVLYCRVITHHKEHTYVNTQSSITSKYCIKSQIYDDKINYVIYIHSIT